MNTPLLVHETRFFQTGRPYYKATTDCSGLKGKTIPSIHMPKTAARIWLEITGVRVERAQDISEEDAVAEGVLSLPESFTEKHFPEYSDKLKEWGESNGGQFPTTRPPLGPSPAEKFKQLWCEIHGRESWDANPWVWCLEFKVLSTTGKPENL